MSVTELAVKTEAEPIATHGDIMLNAPLLAQIDAMAKRMATSRATIPDHLKNNEGDCWAVIMQAIQWRMSPFVVAQKTHVVSGKLGYEAQLVNAVVKTSGAIDGSFSYEYRGAGEQLECRVGARLKGESDITWNEWLMLSSVTTRNSPLWKTNQKQQMGYLQVKNWTRLYAPEALLGVYTADELRESEPSEREIGPRATSSLNEQLRPGSTDTQKEQVVDVEPDPTPMSTLTFAEVCEQINKASDLEQLEALGDTIQEFIATGDNQQFTDEMRSVYRGRKGKLEEAGVAL